MKNEYVTVAQTPNLLWGNENAGAKFEFGFVGCSRQSTKRLSSYDVYWILSVPWKTKVRRSLDSSFLVFFFSSPLQQLPHNHLAFLDTSFASHRGALHRDTHTKQIHHLLHCQQNGHVTRTARGDCSFASQNQFIDQPTRVCQSS